MILADNQFTINAEWYKEALREELMYLTPLVVELGLELTDLGFETPQLDLIIGDQDFSGVENGKEDFAEGPAINGASQRGDYGTMCRSQWRWAAAWRGIGGCGGGRGRGV